MGVMKCSRNNCDSIMCSIYIKDIGYICSECKSEFESFSIKKELKLIHESEIRKELIKFMETTKDYYLSNEKMTIEDFFGKYNT